MAILKVVDQKKYRASGIMNITSYVLRLSKQQKEAGMDSPEQLQFDGVNVFKFRAAEEMIKTKKEWGKTKGRDYYHFIQSYPPDEEITIEEALSQAKRFVKKSPEFKDYQVLLAAHHDKANHIDVHIIVNSVSFLTGKKFHYSRADLKKMKDRQNNLNIKSGYKKAPKKGQNYKFENRTELVANNRKKYSILKKAEKGSERSYIQDCAVAILDIIDKGTATSRKEFINEMDAKGFRTDWQDTRKHVTFIDKKLEAEGQKKCRVRLSNLFDTYNYEEFTKEFIENGFERIKENQQRTAEDRKFISDAIGSLERGNEKTDNLASGKNRGTGGAELESRADDFTASIAARQSERNQRNAEPRKQSDSKKHSEQNPGKLQSIPRAESSGDSELDREFAEFQKRKRADELRDEQARFLESSRRQAEQRERERIQQDTERLSKQNGKTDKGISKSDRGHYQGR